MSRVPLIAGNWKMHNTAQEAVRLVQNLAHDLDLVHGVEVVVCPPFTAIRSVGVVIDLDRVPLALGAQDLHWEEKGAFTGEVSGPMLNELKVRYVIVGHSERRQHFGETDEAVARKVKAAFGHGLVPILCVGETLEEREAGRTEEVVTRQLRAGVDGLSDHQVGVLVVAYEPVWAIGTGRNAQPEDADGVAGLLRKQLGQVSSESAAAKTRILYGGSVQPHNVEGFMARSHIDGALVGGASLSDEDFSRIIELASRNPVQA